MTTTANTNTASIKTNIIDFNAFRQSKKLEAYNPDTKKTCVICSREMDHREPQVNIQGHWVCLNCTAIALSEMRKEQRKNIIAFPGVFHSNTTTGGTTA